MSFIACSCQLIDEADIAAVVSALQSEYLTQGPKIAEFEQALAKSCDANHAVALANGTAALHLAMLALDVNQSSIVWTTPITFVASANAALYVGAKVDFVDIDPQTGNISISALTTKLEQAALENKLPNVLVPVHFTGRACEMDQIKNLATKYNFKIIEDASHALGSNYQSGEKVGSNKYADISTMSFHAVKSITTGEGGACLTQDPELYRRILKLRTHGITRNSEEFINKNLPSWHYEQHVLGYNYRLTDIQAALGVSQLQKLNEFISIRRKQAKYYHEHLLDTSIGLPPVDPASSWHLYSIKVPAAKRDQIFEYCKSKNVGTNTHYQCVHLQPYYQEVLGFKAGMFPAAEKFSQEALAIPIHPKLTVDQQQFVIKTLLESFRD